MKDVFKGEFIKLPWPKWNDVLVSPDSIVIGESRIMSVDDLSLIWWKSRVYDRFGDTRVIPKF